MNRNRYDFTQTSRLSWERPRQPVIAWTPLTFKLLGALAGALLLWIAV